MNAGQLTLDLLAATVERPTTTNGPRPLAAREPDLEALEDLDFDLHDMIMEAELADALPTPRRCECDSPFGDFDPDGDIRCGKCGCEP